MVIGRTLMGLFDKQKRKKADEFDSPVEEIDLSREPSAVFATHVEEDNSSGDVRARPVESGRVAAPVTEATRPVGETRAPRRPGSYGIDDAIALMRGLPSENVELVVQVVKS